MVVSKDHLMCILLVVFFYKHWHLSDAKRFLMRAFLAMNKSGRREGG